MKVLLILTLMCVNVSAQALKPLPNENEKLVQSRRERDKEIAHIRREAELLTRIAVLRDQLKTTEAVVAERDVTIVNLVTEKDSLTREIARLKTVIVRKDENIAHLNAVVIKKDADIAKRDETIIIHETTIRLLIDDNAAWRYHWKRRALWKIITFRWCD